MREKKAKNIVEVGEFSEFLEEPGAIEPNSGGVLVYITGKHEFDLKKFDPRNIAYLCGKQANISFLIMGKTADIKAWGFGYHSYTEEFRANNGTKFLADFKALHVESFLGQTIPLWTGVHFNVTNWTALITWPEPPNSFLRNATVEKYELISGKETTKIFYVMSFPQSGREFLFTGLRPLSNYTGKIIAVLSDGRRGSTDWIGFRTKEGIPSRRPYIEHVKSVDYNSIWLRWSKLHKEETWETLRGYRIHITKAYNFNGSQPFYRKLTVGPDVTAYYVTGLPTETHLRVSVAGFTATGEGIQSYDWGIDTKCGSTLSKSSGVLQSRGYPERMDYADCVWYISSRNKTVFISIEHYDIPYSYQCNYAYVAIGDASGIPPYRYCGKGGGVFALAQAPRVPLLYYTGHRYYLSRKGFKLSYFVMNVSFAEATLVEDWNIVSISDVRPRSIHVEWSHYSPQSPFQVIVYTVVCTPTNDEAGSTLLNIKDTSIHEVDVTRLHFSTNYSVELVAFINNTFINNTFINNTFINNTFINNTFINNSQTGEFILRRSQKAYVVTPEGVPQEPPWWVDATVHINITLNILVQWRAIPSNKVDGRLVGYKVYYRVGDGEFSSKTVGPDVHEIRIDIANVPEPYEIRVAGFTNAGVGPMSWRRRITSCRSIAVSQMGVITNPGFPQSTPGDLFCSTRFDRLDFPTSSVYRFRLVHVVDLMTNRKVGGAPNCSYWQDDYLDWELLYRTAILAGPFCGRVQPFAFVSWGNFYPPILMKFVTGVGNHERVFNSTFFALYDFSKISK
ncbi:PREDICTED: uncharacterized protein LOC107347850 [Acropora digitifera]|uniref:uncharacterized protein LOC107347850 n=1 Tax=Acropora digitifera TaxID=70779 RepID=UPI00077AD565|nr:PREDICTED: uncharacterized protein LOC107347850 [Acropora digitifera]